MHFVEDRLLIPSRRGEKFGFYFFVLTMLGEGFALILLDDGMADFVFFTQTIHHTFQFMIGGMVEDFHFEEAIAEVVGVVFGIRLPAGGDGEGVAVVVLAEGEGEVGSQTVHGATGERFEFAGGDNVLVDVAGEESVGVFDPLTEDFGTVFVFVFAGVQAIEFLFGNEWIGVAGALDDGGVGGFVFGAEGVGMHPGVDGTGRSHDEKLTEFGGGGDESVFDRLADFVAVFHKAGFVENNGHTAFCGACFGMVTADGVGIGGEEFDFGTVLEAHLLIRYFRCQITEIGITQEVEKPAAEVAAHALAGGDDEDGVVGSRIGMEESDNTGGEGFSGTASGDEHGDSLFGEAEFFLVGEEVQV